MKEVVGDLWTFEVSDHPVSTWRGIPTNGVVRNDKLVMGAGVAKDAKDRYPSLPKKFGKHVKKYGNSPCFLIVDHDGLFSFPTKEHYQQNADGKLIMKSAVTLAEVAINNPYDKFIIPRPGVGLGKLDWGDIRPLLLTLLPDNVFVVSK